MFESLVEFVVLSVMCALSSYWLASAMDTRPPMGILGPFALWRDRTFPYKENGNMQFFGAILGQCEYCMNSWLTIIVSTVAVLLIPEYLSDMAPIQRYLCCVPAMFLSNAILMKI